MKLFYFLALFILFFGCMQFSEPTPEEPLVPSNENISENVTEEQSPPENLTEEEPPPIIETELPPEEPSAQPEEEPTLESEDIVYTSFGWDVHATFYPSANTDPTKVVLLMPGLGQVRGSYPQNFITLIHEEMPELAILAIDPRGHGESTALGVWENFTSAEFKDMRQDVLDGMEYLGDHYPTIDSYYVVGASMGSTAAILAGAMENDIIKIAMISPGMEYQGVDIERAADDYMKPLLLVASAQDSYSVSAISEIDSLSSSGITKKIYSGSAHGTDLFEATENETESLSDLILNFLK
ncbi:alpha/beta fold hydrolase [Candidatus Micrarchaeota archaeon]|nr:alpha/beta fold hydrolase [Candidatus Micrarchaeota archaeon]